ncbi:MAG: Ger(x)C family spore germination C-terminal domain-containing protein [Eubacteriales bacterium]|nr:hypothetical protein [Clostridiales bacterium]MDD6931746.1 Ger(x)C family spore germination C-terminal domain-containing protein [Eubacteriales bacterium]MDY2602232.1 Ger(x)C family spore germination C-terminal domain-containing protein [Eubacteriales bacterium]
MKRAAALAMALVFTAAALTGCSEVGYLEHQAYAIIIGIDREAEETVLTVKFPQMTGASGEKSGSDSYVTTESRGINFRQAMETLKLGIPRKLNLSATVLIVVSRKIAESGEIREITQFLISDHRLYSAAYFAVCQGDARSFVEAQEPSTGTRLSEGLKAMVKNGENQGIIPQSRLADVYYLMNSVYSDPLVMLCALKDEEGTVREPGDNLPRDVPVSYTGDNQYTGACALKDGKAAIYLTGLETIYANLLLGNASEFTCAMGERAAYVTLRRKPKIRVRREKDGAKVEIEMRFTGYDVAGELSAYELAEHLRGRMLELIGRCQAAGVEPLGFADQAAKGSATVEDWKKFNWAEQFPRAEIDLQVTVTKTAF